MSTVLNTGLMVNVMVFNTTFNNILTISWWSVLLVEETGVPTPFLTFLDCIPN
jgi:hypothetical protein